MRGDDQLRSELYGDIAPARTGLLQVDPRHQMYWESSGNADGVAVLFLHGGPGAGTAPAHRRFFDPEHYHIVLFDQRGAGKSRPLGELVDNTTIHLIADIETLRRHLGIERWILFGGSWGSTLALAYAQAHPDQCIGLVLRGVFLCRPHEVDWFLGGIGHVFPEVWRRFAEFIPQAERDDLLGAYMRRLNDADAAVHMPAALAWAEYEGSSSTLLPSPDTVAAFRDRATALGLARIEAHYLKNTGFLAEDQLLVGIEAIRHLPGAIIQGRYDMVCPIATADELVRAWPGATYTIVADAGHSAMEPGIRAALVGAMERFKALS